MNQVPRSTLAICLAFWLGFSTVIGVNAAPLAEPATTPTFSTKSWALSVAGVGEGGIVETSSPTLADLTGDGIPEVLVGTTAKNGAGGYDKKTFLVAMTWDGTTSNDNMEILWAVDAGAPINSSPAVGDIDGNGTPEVVVSLGGNVGDLNQHGGIMVYTNMGQPYKPGVSNFPFRTHDRLHPLDGYADGVFSTPALCDVDADGDLEIAFGGWDHRIYLLDHNGDSLWNPHDPPYGEGYYSQDTVWSSPACADLNQDGYKEIIIGADITQGTFLDGQPAYNGGLLYVFDKDGTVLVRRYVPRALYSSPAIGDLDGDGDLEIVVGTSFGESPQPYVYVFDTSQVFNAGLDYYDPAKLPDYDPPTGPGWPRPTAYEGFSSPALADLDGDGDLEIVIGSGDTDPDGDLIAGEGAVYVWHHDGTLASGWPIYPKCWWNHVDDTYISSSPTIADVDGDPSDLEIMFAMVNEVYVYNFDGSAQALNQLDLPPCWPPNDTLRTTDGYLWASPTVGDADGDGKVEIWIGGHDNTKPGVGHLWRFESDQSVGEMPWPSFHRDAQNRGCLAPPLLKGQPDSLYIMHEYGTGSTASDTIFIDNAGEGEIDWVAISDSPTVTLNATSGTVDGAGQTVSVTISTDGYVTGTYSLGDIVITGTVEGDASPGSPVTIPVTLYVGPIHRVYLPTVLSGY